MKVNYKLDHLSKKQIEKFFSLYSLKLYEYFSVSNSDSQEQLQKEFREWRVKNITQQRAVIDYVLECVIDELHDQNIINKKFSMTWRDVADIKLTRWHICQICHQPFIDISKNGKMLCCYHNVYKRYDLTNKKFFLSTDNKSMCEMERNRLKVSRYRRLKKAN